MIEKYFLTDARYKWNCPAHDVPPLKDGAIIDSPARANAPLTYDGMDPELNIGGPHPSTVGLTMRMNIPYDWLVYSHGKTTRLALGGNDVLTGPMSGCLIAEWTAAGRRYVGHVGTIESDPAVNARVKNTFADFYPSQGRGFFPAAAWPPGEIMPKMQKFKRMPAIKIMALVTTSVEFYAILMFHLGMDEWCCGGIKKVPPTNAMILKATLRTDQLQNRRLR